MKRIFLPLLAILLFTSCEKEPGCYVFQINKEVTFINNGDTIPHPPYCPTYDTVCGLYPNEVETYCKIFTKQDTLYYGEFVIIGGCGYDGCVAYVDQTVTVIEQ